MDLGAIIGRLGQGGSAGGGLDAGRIGQLAQQFGIPPELANQALNQITAATQSGAAQSPEQAVEQVSRSTGVDAGALAQLLQGLVGAGGARGGFMDMATSMLDRNKDGSVIDDLSDLAGGFLKR